MIRIDGYAIDAAISEQHQRSAEATTYPVEDGADVTDHVRIDPIMVVIEGVVTDTPHGAVANERGQPFETDEGLTGTLDSELLPSEEALAKLEEIFTARQPVRIETSLRAYDSMVLIGLDVPRDRETGHALRFTASFQELRIRQSRRTTVRVAVPRAAPKRALGVRPVKSADGKPIRDPRTGKPIGMRNGKLVDLETGRELTPEEIADINTSRRWESQGRPVYKTPEGFVDKKTGQLVTERPADDFVGRDGRVWHWSGSNDDVATEPQWGDDEEYLSQLAGPDPETGAP